MEIQNKNILGRAYRVAMDGYRKLNKCSNFFYLKKGVYLSSHATALIYI